MLQGGIMDEMVPNQTLEYQSLHSLSLLQTPKGFQTL